MKPQARILTLTNFLILLLVLTAIILVYYQFFFTYSENADVQGESQLMMTELDDHCGFFGGKLQHLVADEGECTSKCLGYCTVKQYTFVNTSFLWGEEQRCNQCYCLCKS